MARRERFRRVVLGGLLVVGAGLGAAAATGAFGPSQLTPAERAAIRAREAAAARRRALALQARIVASASSLVDVALPTTAGSPAPAAPAALFTTPLAKHIVIGFVPYWEMATLSPSDYADTSVLSYFGVDVDGSGNLVRSGYGWNDYLQSGFTSFVSQAHAAGDRVLFTVSTTDPRAIKELTSSPAATASRLAAQLATVVANSHLDGVDIDIEGRAASERRGFVRFVSDLTAALRTSAPADEIVLDTYPQSALSGSSSDFFDVKALAPYVDTMFIMAYDMNDPVHSSASSPLSSASLGLSDIEALRTYTKVVAPSKLVIGLPMYGYDYSTVGKTAGSTDLGTAPFAVTYSSIVQAGHAVSWDPGSETPYTLFKLAGQTHQTWFDDPVSIALKTALADEFRLAGVGAWALGQEGDQTSMLSALDGDTAPIKLPLPSSTS